MKGVSLFIIAVALTIPMSAQDINNDGYESLLVPIAFSEHQRLPGAYGTLWAGEIWVHNASPIDIRSLQETGICIPSPCPISFRSGFRGRWPSVESNGNNGAMLHVPRQAAGSVFVSARLLELSRNSQPTGVEVPVIKESDFFTGERWLLAVPVGEGTRAALRIYDPRALADTAVRVDFFSPGGDFFTPAGMLIESVVLRPGDDPRAGYVGNFPTPVPSVAAKLNLAFDLPALAAYEYVHIKTTPLQEGRQYWVMATVTHNDTQHVLLVTSQPD
jgi:hypothetical protein